MKRAGTTVGSASFVALTDLLAPKMSTETSTRFRRFNRVPETLTGLHLLNTEIYKSLKDEDKAVYIVATNHIAMDVLARTPIAVVCALYVNLFIHYDLTNTLLQRDDEARIFIDRLNQFEKRIRSHLLQFPIEQVYATNPACGTHLCNVLRNAIKLAPATNVFEYKNGSRVAQQETSTATTTPQPETTTTKKRRAPTQEEMKEAPEVRRSKRQCARHPAGYYATM